LSGVTPGLACFMSFLFLTAGLHLHFRQKMIKIDYILKKCRKLPFYGEMTGVKLVSGGIIVKSIQANLDDTVDFFSVY